MKSFLFALAIVVAFGFLGCANPAGTGTTTAAVGGDRALIAADGSIIRLEASNVPGYAIRHINGAVQIDTVINPWQDAQFKLVPGLATSSGVSFESVNFPGQYLRHRNGLLYKDANDGSALYAADATWYQRAGLADANLVSFESYNFPGEYIRHQNFIVKRTPISSQLDRQDATFKVWKFNWSWVRGAVYVPSSATNEVQQWDEYDPALNDRELANIATYGVNVVRVYLHYLVWEKDKNRLLANVEDFLARASKYGIKTEIIFFDDCWNPNPTIGAPYPPPLFGIHNSRWVQCPGDFIKNNYAAYQARLQSYVQDVVNAHKSDSRIVFWEPYNEPGNGQSGLMYQVTNQILTDSRNWIKNTGTTIPITSCDFAGTISNGVSDFYSYHCYDSNYSGPRGKSLLVTEGMQRQSQSVPGMVNAFSNQGTGFIMWEAINGRDNCRYPWGNTNVEPTVPFHPLIYPDGHPWSLADVQAFKGNDLSSAPVFNVTYFGDTNLSVQKKVSITPRIDFDLGNEFGTGSPDASAGIGIDNFSIRWTGVVRPTSSGTYTFYADADNIARVWVGGVQVINKTSGGRSESSGAVVLPTANANYALKVEYVHATGNASLHVQWSGPNLTKQILLGRR